MKNKQCACALFYTLLYNSGIVICEERSFKIFCTDVTRQALTLDIQSFSSLQLILAHLSKD